MRARNGTRGAEAPLLHDIRGHFPHFDTRMGMGLSVNRGLDLGPHTLVVEDEAGMVGHGACSGARKQP
jgi:hypothetical protein